MLSPLATFWAIATYWLAIFLPRLSLPIIVPMLAAEMGASPQQRASMLSFFFRGYLLTMVAGGVAAQKWGGKLVLSIDLAGFTASFLALPWAMSKGPRAVAVTLALMGIFFGPLLPATSVIKNHWNPTDGAEKAVAAMIMGIGTKMARITSVSATPLLCASGGGWRAAVRTYGAAAAAVAVGWQLLVRERPPHLPEKTAAQVPDLKPVDEKTFEPRIFRVRSVQAIIAMHTAYNNSDYSIITWAPTYFKEVLGVPAAGVGKYLVIPTILNMGGTFIFGSIEALVLRKKILTELGVRRWSTVLGTFCSASGLTVFALCRHPLAAAMAYSTVALGQGLHHSGFLPNYLEVGGKVRLQTILPIATTLLRPLLIACCCRTLDFSLGSAIQSPTCLA